MVVKNTEQPVVFRNILPAEIPTFRNLLHNYLDKGHQPWSKFGIDILLGANLDKKVDNQTAMFLPDYLMKGFDSASTGNKPLVGATHTVLTVATPPKEGDSWFTPFVLFAALFFFIAALSILKGKSPLNFVTIL